MIFECRRLTVWKHPVAIERGNTVYASIKNGEFASNGMKMGYMVLRLLTNIQEVT